MKKIVNGEEIEMSKDEIDEYNAYQPTEAELLQKAKEELDTKKWALYKASRDADEKTKWKQRGKPSFIDDIT